MSSAGLIFKYFGREVCQNIAHEVYQKKFEKDELELLYKSVYKHLIKEVDAIDNGVNLHDS